MSKRPALSRYGHGDICSDCGITEALVGDFISVLKIKYERPPGRQMDTV